MLDEIQISIKYKLPNSKTTKDANATLINAAEDEQRHDEIIGD